MLKNCVYFVLFLILASCSVYEPVQIQVLKPAGTKIDNRISRVLLINNSVIAKEAQYHKVVTLDSTSTREYFYGLANILTNSPNFSVVDSIYYFKKNLVSRFERLNWDIISKLCADSSADAAIVLENFQIVSNNPPEVQFSPMVGYYTKFVVENSSLWRIYYPAERKILFEYLLKDTIFWEASSFYEFELKYQLPYFESAVSQSCFLAGEKFGEHIAPSWIAKNRFIVSNELKDFQNAAYYAKGGNWEKAIEIWKKYPYSKNKRFAANAAYNLAIASETLDHLDIALEWAAKSYLLKPNDYVKKYIELLEKRLIDKDKYLKEN